jgi:thiol-disulfide isomerase/thioredoxin
MQKHLWLIPACIVGFLFFRYLTRPATSLINGNPAPNFSGTTLSGETLNLTDFKGKVVLLDFWGSWCAPCRAANPSLVALYNNNSAAKFRQIKGFDIISIGLESGENMEKWKKAIAQDGLVWKHHIFGANDFDFPIAKQYGISSIPTTFLIDENGILVGVNLTKSAIEAFLAKK